MSIDKTLIAATTVDAKLVGDLALDPLYVAKKRSYHVKETGIGTVSFCKQVIQPQYFV